MSVRWWEMPGPRHFAQRVVTSLREGKNVLLQLPAGYPEGLRSSIQLASGRAAERSRHFTVATGSKHRPLALLYANSTHKVPEPGMAVSTLANHPAFAGQLIWIDGVGSDNWPLWRQFMLEYEHACRAISEYERSLICLTLVGPVADTEETPGPQICLDIWRYAQQAGILDTLLYTAMIMPDGGLVGVKRRVAIAAIAQLAQWDPAVCEWLSRQSLATILRPQATLEDFGRQRGWDHGDYEPSWCHGTFEVVDETPRQHSAICALQCDSRELARRVWVAQLSELFPLLEQRRQELLSDLDAYLSIPFTTGYGEVITLKEDLELGHILWQLSQLQRSGRRDSRIIQAVQTIHRLKKMRDTLAHLKVLEEDELLL